MRPGDFAVIPEIVGIGNLTALRLVRLLDAEGNAVALRIGDGLFLALEAQAHLALHVGRGGVAHQRVDLARRLRLEFQNPVTGLGGAGLHGRLGRAENARRHFSYLVACVVSNHVVSNCKGRTETARPGIGWSERQDSNLRPPAPKAGALPS